ISLERSDDTIPAEGRHKQMPERLEDICHRCMERVAEDRYESARNVADEVASWLEGTRKQQEAMQVVNEAKQRWPQVGQMRDEARSLRLQARTLLSQLPVHAKVEQKRRAWELEDEAARLEREAEVEHVQVMRLVHGSLTLVPDLVEAHQFLANHYVKRHRAAEERGDERACAALELLLRTHDRGQHDRYLQGDGSLSLHTDPPGAEVELYRYEEGDRRLVPSWVRSLGNTPLNQISLPMGSYLLVLRHPGRIEVRHPVHVGRLEDVNCQPPTTSVPHPVYLPDPGDIEPDEAYIAAGWFRAGASTNPIYGPLWLDGFVVRTNPVTNREYLAFLNDLVARGRNEAAARHVPREQSGRPNSLGPM
ncbi:MAG: protein kinase, partial [Myxococcota bacterium]|nr:protein kinase [Myxococcota bacterium]